MANKLKMLRARAGMSQDELAAKAGTTARQIRRTESGKFPTKIGIAEAICAAIGKPVEFVFPGSRKALAAMAEALAGSRHIPDAVHDQLRSAGLEADIREHTLKVMLRGHAEPMYFGLWPHEVDRLFKVVQSEPPDPTELSFLVFDTVELSVAISLRAIVFCQFLWDFDIGNPSIGQHAQSDEHLRQAVVLFLGENPVPILISPEPDLGTEIDDDRNYLNGILYDLDSGPVHPHQRLHVVDEDGESAFIRAGDLTLLTVPLWALDPEEHLDDCDGDDDEDGDDSPDGGAPSSAPTDRPVCSAKVIPISTNQGRMS